MKDLQKKYNFLDTEKKWQEYWQKNKIFSFNKDDNNLENIYSIDTPPPHVSGVLHMGHVFGYSQMDIIARFQRMNGKNVFFPVGYDDNGLPSERYVEKKIGKKSKEMERSKFVEICDKEIQDAEQMIRDLFIRASYSFDFDEEYRTISKRSSTISQMSFLDLYNKGLVYRKEEPVIWDVVDQTALAQSELEDKDIESQMNYLKFTTTNGKEVEIMTTRPELLPACVAVMCHTDDVDKFASESIVTPLGVEVPVIADDKVDKEKGTGLVMCCTFGDQTDIEWWRKYNLSLKIIINEVGRIDLSKVRDTLAPKYLELNNLKIVEARAKILELLENDGYITRKPQKIIHSVKIGERSKFPVEFLVTKQWFVKILDNKDKLHEQVDKINWKPNWMKARLHNWIDGLSWDWCISRQRFFGIPIPIWYSKRKGEEGKILVATKGELPVDPTKAVPKGYKIDEVEAETDIFDTWATSAVTPQLAIFGVTEDLNLDDVKFRKLKIPFSLRAQGHDIIRTWAFYSIIKSLYHNETIPWKNIMINGWCLAPDGTKMSKSIGNVIDPIKIFDRFGSDAVRYWTANSTLGMDTNYLEETVRSGQKLITKLFNCAKFAEIHFKNILTQKESLEEDLKNGYIFETIDIWLIVQLNNIIKLYTENFDNYEYNKALENLEDFFWNDFCDNYLEIVKIRCYGAEGIKYQNINLTKEEVEDIKKSQISAIKTIYHVFNSILKLFAPFIPVVTEEIYSCLFEDEFNRKKSIHSMGNLPKVKILEYGEEIAAIGSIVLKIVADIRKYKSEKNMSMKDIIEKTEIHSPYNLESVIEDIKNVCNITSVNVVKADNYTIKIE